MSDGESFAERWMRRYRIEHQEAAREIEAQCHQELFGVNANTLTGTAEQSKNQGGGLRRSSRVVLSPVVASAIQVRKQLKLTQAGFARCLNISPRTLRDWEQGRRCPSGAALTLLSWSVDRPDYIRELCKREERYN